MTLRKVLSVLALSVLFAAVAAAAVCPLCLQQIPDGQKYCERHQAEQTAKTLTVAQEQKLADDLVKARAEYRLRLDALLKYYKDVANAEGLRKVEAELKNLDAGPQFAFANWEDALPELTAANVVPEADALLAEADAARKGVNPFTQGDRMRAAAVKYQEILIKYPNSTAVESAAYALGDIYSSNRVSEPARAVKFFDLCYRSNPQTKRDATFRAATLCDNVLSEYENAAKYYWLTTQTTDSSVLRKRAQLRLSGLQKGGFGAAYKTEAPAPDAPKDNGEKK